MMIEAVCSNKPRPSVQGPRSYFLKTGQSAWGRDVWHALGKDGKTLCGINAADWLKIGAVEADDNFCKRCASHTAPMGHEHG